MKYVLSGSLDTGFGSGGKAITTVGAGYDWANAVAIQSNGKILLAGESYNGGSDDFALVRYNAIGTLDTTFGNGGKVKTDFASKEDDANSIAIQSDGKIVLAGSSNNGSNWDIALARYNLTGSLDTSFGLGGKVITDFESVDNEGYFVLLQPDGKILVAGLGNNGSNTDFILVRYNSDGSLDTSFGNGGKVLTDFASGDDEAWWIGLQPDGRIVVIGFANNGGNSDFALARYNSDGSLDSSFGSGGKVLTPIGSGEDEAWWGALQPDGKIVVVGEFSNGGQDDFVLVRYNAGGLLDPSFGTGGMVKTAIGSGTDKGYSIALQTDGKIVAAGYSHNGTNDDFALVRYNPDGSLDTGFGTGGKVTTAMGSGGEQIYAIALQSDGKIVAGGGSNNGSNDDFAIARYNP